MVGHLFDIVAPLISGLSYGLDGVAHLLELHAQVDGLQNNFWVRLGLQAAFRSWMGSIACGDASSRILARQQEFWSVRPANANAREYVCIVQFELHATHSQSSHMTTYPALHRLHSVRYVSVIHSATTATSYGDRVDNRSLVGILQRGNTGFQTPPRRKT